MVARKIYVVQVLIFENVLKNFQMKIIVNMKILDLF